MKEVICIHIGQAGIQMSSPIWELFCLEHNISLSGEKINDNNELTDNSNLPIFFQENSNGKYTPRTLFIDTDPEIINKIKTSNLQNLYSKNFYVNCKEDSGSNYGRASFLFKLCLDEIKNKINKLIDSCDKLQGIFIFNSLGGGTGSGFTSNLLNELNNEMGLSNIPNICFSIFPSQESLSTVVEPYNTILSIPNYCDNNHSSIILNNKSLYNICEKYLNIENPNYDHINLLIAHLFSNITASLRFKGTINSNINELLMNLNIYPRQHFLLTSNTPFIPKEKEYLENYSIDRITNLAFETDYQMSYYNLKTLSYTKYCAMNLMFRGDIIQPEIHKAINSIKEKKKIKIHDCSPSPFKYGFTYEPNKFLKDRFLGKILKSVCVLQNSDSVEHIFDEISMNFDLLYSKRAYIFHFIGEGLPEGQFQESREEIAALSKDYEQVIGESGESFDSDNTESFIDIE